MAFLVERVEQLREFGSGLIMEFVFFIISTGKFG